MYFINFYKSANQIYDWLSFIVYRIQNICHCLYFQLCYDALIGGVGEKTTIDKAIDVIKERYAKDETDEFLKPIILSDEGRTKGESRSRKAY